MRRSIRNVQLRLPPALKARLAQERDEAASSLNAVIERRIVRQLDVLPADPGPALWRRMDASQPGSTFAFADDVFDRITAIAKRCNTNRGEAAYNLLLASLEPNQVAAA